SGRIDGGESPQLLEARIVGGPAFAVEVDRLGELDPRALRDVASERVRILAWRQGKAQERRAVRRTYQREGNDGRTLLGRDRESGRAGLRSELDEDGVGDPAGGTVAVSASLRSEGERGGGRSGQPRQSPPLRALARKDLLFRAVEERIFRRQPFEPVHRGSAGERPVGEVASAMHRSPLRRWRGGALQLPCRSLFPRIGAA